MSYRNAVLRDEVQPLETLRRDNFECSGDKGANLGDLIAVCNATGYARAIPALLGRKRGRYGSLSTTEEWSPSIRGKREGVDEGGKHVPDQDFAGDGRLR